MPVYKLLGGAVRDKVRMYTHLGGGDMSSVYESFDAGRVIELAQQVVERGYTAVKVVFVPYSEPLVSAPLTVATASTPTDRVCAAPVESTVENWPLWAVTETKFLEP